MAKTKPMSRARTQIATAYAPESFFTYEGGLGACIAKSLPTLAAELRDSTRYQIFERLDEYARTWFGAAITCRDDAPGKPQVVARQCADITFLNASRDGYDTASEDKFYLCRPSMMAYVPTPLTFCCNACKLVRVFATAKELEVALPQLNDKNKCPHPAKQCKCDWRQMDVVFVHWSGSWVQPMPYQYQWNANQSKVTLNRTPCACGSEDFELVNKSPAIGDWFFRCAEPKCHKPVSQKWLQNDPETLRIIGSDYKPERITEVRMQVTPYRASAAYSLHSAQFIDFREGASELLTLLRPTQREQLIAFIAERYGFGAMLPDDSEIEKAARAGGADKDWEDYKSIEESIVGTEAIIATLPAAQATLLKGNIDHMREARQRILRDLVDRGIVKLKVNLPARLLETIDQHANRFAAAYDPVRLAVEHATLKETKLDPDKSTGGKRAYVRFDSLDEDLSPKTEAETKKLQDDTRRLLNLLGIAEMGLIREFDLCRFSFGYSRMSSTPVLREKRSLDMPVRLNLFPRVNTENGRRHPIYVVTQGNEAIYCRLNPVAVYTWLQGLNCTDMFTLQGDEAIGAGLLSVAYPMERYLEGLPRSDNPQTYLYAYTLLQSYAHLMMRYISEYSGLDLGSLGEYIFPTDLAFIVYRNGTTMDLGNLSAMWRNSSTSFLTALSRPRAVQCGTGTLCTRRGGACPDCIMVPETSCIAGNKLVSRSVLRSIGGRPRFDTRHQFEVTGYLDVVKKLAWD